MPRKNMILTPEQIEQVERLAAVLRIEDIAWFLGIADRTFHKKMTEDERVRAAYEKGRARAKAAVGTGLLQKARDGDLTAMIFYAKTQMGWRETERREHINIDLDSLTDEELEQVARGEYPTRRSR